MYVHREREICIVAYTYIHVLPTICMWIYYIYIYEYKYLCRLLIALTHAVAAPRPRVPSWVPPFIATDIATNKFMIRIHECPFVLN